MVPGWDHTLFLASRAIGVAIWVFFRVVFGVLLRVPRFAVVSRILVDFFVDGLRPTDILRIDIFNIIQKLRFGSDFLGKLIA